MNKVYSSAALAVADVPEGAALGVGGFGICGVPNELIQAIHQLGVGGLRVVSNNGGIDDWGLGVLLRDRRIVRMTSSYVGENKEFARQYLIGELELELTPQGTLAERLRAGGSGIPAFYTPTGVGTQVAEGGLPWRYQSDGTVAVSSPAKEVRLIGARQCVLEEAIVCDFGLVHASKGDRNGNLVFSKAARNFNPLCAMASSITVAQVEQLVEPGELDPDEIHLPGIYVDRVVLVGTDIEKPFERRTTRTRLEVDR